MLHMFKVYNLMNFHIEEMVHTVIVVNISITPKFPLLLWYTPKCPKHLPPHLLLQAAADLPSSTGEFVSSTNGIVRHV